MRQRHELGFKDQIAKQQDSAGGMVNGRQHI
jgi:hypothetical protein